MSSDTLPRHAAFGITEGIHIVVAGTIDDVAAMSAGTVKDPPATSRTVDAGDVGKFFMLLAGATSVDDSSVWMLENNSPVSWIRATFPGGDVLAASAGAADAGKVPALDTDGLLDLSLTKPHALAFTTTLLFDQNYRVADHTLTADITMAVDAAGAVSGAQSYGIFIGDGTHTVDFSAYTRVGGSDFDVGAGARNHYWVWFDGTNYCYTLAQDGASAAIGGSTGSTDNALLRADGTGGSTAQATGITVDDSNNVSGIGTLSTTGRVNSPLVKNEQTGTSYTITLGDVGKCIVMNNALANTLFIPTDATLYFDIGVFIPVLQGGAGQTTIAAVTPGTTAVRAPNGAKTPAQFRGPGIWKYAVDEWWIIGDATT